MKFTTTEMMNVDFYLPEFSTTKIVTRKCQVDDSTEIRYDRILGIGSLRAQGICIGFSDHVIIGDSGPY